ncbi:MAG: CidA/LrgA family protein [Gemmatimonadaceae bacterium]|nr:CidA/LrgA family protein [Gemmatimonadaceae bacterium]
MRRGLELLAGAMVLVLLDAVGTWTARAVGIPMPGSVLGMLLLVVLLRTGILPDTLVAGAADFLVRHLALLYVPAGVAILLYAGNVGREVVAIVLAAVTSLLVGLVVIGIVAQRLERAAE